MQNSLCSNNTVSRTKSIKQASNDFINYLVLVFCPFSAFEQSIRRIYSTYKIVLDGKIIGGLTCCNAGEYYWLGGIYISKAYQNQGIGAKAIAFLENEFPDAKCWRLHTPYKNYRNHHFYEKMGYRKIGETEPKEDKNGFFLYEYEKRIL